MSNSGALAKSSVIKHNYLSRPVPAIVFHSVRTCCCPQCHYHQQWCRWFDCPYPYQVGPLPDRRCLWKTPFFAKTFTHTLTLTTWLVDVGYNIMCALHQTPTSSPTTTLTVQLYNFNMYVNTNKVSRASQQKISNIFSHLSRSFFWKALSVHTVVPIPFQLMFHNPLYLEAVYPYDPWVAKFTVAFTKSKHTPARYGAFSPIRLTAFRRLAKSHHLRTRRYDTAISDSTGRSVGGGVGATCVG